MYLLDSQDSLLRYRNSELAASIPSAYQADGTPRRELLELLFPFRPELAPYGAGAGPA